MVFFHPGYVNLTYENNYYETTDGISIHGWFIPADSSEKVILFCHGNAGNISHRLESIQVFNRLGLNVFIFDYRGYGNSKGTISEEGTYLDAAGAWDFLINQKGYESAQIIVFGRSLGTGIASWLAREKDPGGLILESSYTALPDLGAKIYHYFSVRILSRYNYPPQENLNHINCPKLFIHSRDDVTIPFDNGLLLYESSPEPKRFLEIRGDHNGGFLESGEVYTDNLREFIAASLAVSEQNRPKR